MRRGRCQSERSGCSLAQKGDCRLNDLTECQDSAHPDGLRTLDQLGSADVRMQHFAVREGGTSRPFGQEDRYENISRFDLRHEVPADVRVHFDTARNLYLYAWFVYRFHVVAEQHTLASLEMALRLRLIERSVPTTEGKLVTRLPPKVVGGPDRQHIERPMLSRLLQLAVEHGLIHNENFANRSHWAQTMAEHRARIQQLEYMTANGLTEMAVADEAPIPTPEEFDHDWIATFIETLPSIRNTYAHGSSMLHASVLRTFEVVADLINQLFTPASGGGKT